MLSDSFMVVHLSRKDASALKGVRSRTDMNRSNPARNVTEPHRAAQVPSINRPASRRGVAQFLRLAGQMPGIVLLAVLGAVAYRLTTAAQRKRDVSNTRSTSLEN